jgi:hypothetical protein
MRVHPLSAALVALLLLNAPARADLKLPRVSQNASVTQTIGITDLSIKYSRPGVKGRTIWGGLVPYAEPWRTGANEATSFTTSGDLTVEGQPLPAGTYAFLTIPGPDEWTVVFSRQKDMWGAFSYDSTNDQLRVTVKPQPADFQEWMGFTFDLTSPETCDLALRWEKLRLPVHLAVDVNGSVLAGARAEVAAAKSDDWRTPLRAANWANDAGLAPEDVAAWSKAALAIQENPSTLSLAARLARKAGDTKAAVASMTKAIALGKADKNMNADQLATMEKQLAEWTAKKK